MPARSRAPHRDRRGAPGTDFALLDWALLGGAALFWGASFLFIELGLEHFSPGAVAFLRLFFGVAALALLPAARGSVAAADLPLTALLGLVWMAVPFLLFPVAQESIDSSLAGMINASAPLFTAAVAAVVVRRLPTRIQGLGLVLGLAGVVAIGVPSIEGGSSARSVLLVALATLLYGCAFNLAGPLQCRNGALPVIWRAQVVALVLLAPVGAIGLADSGFAWSSLLAMIALGSLGTGAAFAWFATLAGRVGPTRASITTYFLPVVAIALGALALDEVIHWEALLGTALVLCGAYLASRARPLGGRRAVMAATTGGGRRAPERPGRGRTESR